MNNYKKIGKYYANGILIIFTDFMTNSIDKISYFMYFAYLFYFNYLYCKTFEKRILLVSKKN